MIVLIDESGDCGFKFDRGSSDYFTCVAVLFSDGGAAEACDRNIHRLQRELKRPPQYEFHFSHCSDRVRHVFLRTLDAEAFRYAGFVVEKKKLYEKRFRNPKQLYEFAVRLAREQVEAVLEDAKVIIDKNGDRKFKEQLERSLKAHMTDADGVCGIKRVTMETSHSNNLVQLADMVCGAVGRSFTSGDDSFRTLVKQHEGAVQRWPRQ